MAVSVKLGKNETAGASFLINIGQVYTVRLKGEGGRSAMTRKDIFAGRQDGGKSYTGKILGVYIDEHGTLVMKMDCSKQFNSIIREIHVNTITSIDEYEEYDD